MRIRKWLFISIVFALFIIFSELIKAQEFGNFEQLTLKISTEIKEILPMEPLPYIITLSNNTKKTIKGNNDINPGTGFTKIYVATDTNPFELFRSSDQPSLTGIVGKSDLISGYSISFNGYLFCAHPENLDKENRGQYLFESPGDYRIKVTFEDFDGNTIE